MEIYLAAIFSSYEVSNLDYRAVTAIILLIAHILRVHEISSDEVNML
jgi:hypothetical protein